MLTLDEARIGLIGVGYVGLPLAVAFGREYPTVRFDISQRRIAGFRNGIDTTREVSPQDLKRATLLTFSSTPEDLKACNVYIVTVPTPVDHASQPDLSAVIAAGEMVGNLISVGDVVVYESTVYPGATKEISVPILENRSGPSFNQDFVVGYSPERINPGEKVHRLEEIVKVTAASTPRGVELVDSLYASIVPAGTYPVSSIKVAETVKVIENTQRDVNIALINELAMIFERMGIDTREVLDTAASTTIWGSM